MRDIAAQRSLQFAVFGFGLVALFSIFRTRANANPQQVFDIPAVPNIPIDQWDNKVSEVFLESVATVTGAKISRGFRNNNPGNIRDTRETWRGEIGADDSGYLMFATLEDGLRALHRVLFNYGRRYSLNTVRGVIDRWAPAADSNNVVAYVAHVSREMNIGPDDPLNVDSPGDMVPLAQAIVLHENGYNTVTNDQQHAAFIAARN